MTEVTSLPVDKKLVARAFGDRKPGDTAAANLVYAPEDKAWYVYTDHPVQEGGRREIRRYDCSMGGIEGLTNFQEACKDFIERSGPLVREYMAWIEPSLPPEFMSKVGQGGGNV